MIAREGFHGGGGGRGRGGGRGIEGPLIYPPNRPVAVAPRLTDGSQDALINRFKEQGRKQVEMLTRPGWGTLGVPTHLRSNFFTVKLPKGPFYDYSVTITDVTPKTVDNGGKGGKGGKGRGKPRSGDDSPTNIKAPIKKRIFELLEEDKLFERYKSFVVHDYSQRIVAAKELPQPLKLTITFREEDEK
jgi:eukaryotic translation initiation factor 2C